MLFIAAAAVRCLLDDGVQGTLGGDGFGDVLVFLPRLTALMADRLTRLLTKIATSFAGQEVDLRSDSGTLHEMRG